MIFGSKAQKTTKVKTKYGHRKCDFSTCGDSSITASWHGWKSSPVLENVTSRLVPLVF